MACKPDFVQALRLWMTIPLPTVSPRRSSCQPGPLGRWRPCGGIRACARTGPARGPYLALLRVGLAVPVLLPVPRWALTPPFHLYPCEQEQSLLCGAFPGVTPAGDYPAPLPSGVRTFLEACAPRSSSHPRETGVRRARPRRQRQTAAPDQPQVRDPWHQAGREPTAGSAGGTPQAEDVRLRRDSRRHWPR